MLDFGIKDFIDIVLVALLLFYCYKFMKQTRSVNIFYGLLIFVCFWVVVSKFFEMKLLGSILDKLVSVGAIALIILFQDEIRHFFYSLGTHERAKHFVRFFRLDRHKLENGMRHTHDEIFPIVLACLNMSKQRVGALIVLKNDLPLNDIIRTGEVLDGRVSQRLIENIFFKNTPLHDGAMIVDNNRIVAASCILPISHDLDIPKDFGLRHRAAKGVSKETDALAIVVSEETGHISAAYQDTFLNHLSAEELEQILMKGKF